MSVELKSGLVSDGSTSRRELLLNGEILRRQPWHPLTEWGSGHSLPLKVIPQTDIRLLPRGSLLLIKTTV